MTRIRPGAAGIPESTDVLVIGLGVTGAGVALDAASRGLSVVAVDAHDVAFGTSRWSSKLVHGGLRYLASGQVGVAHESAVERGILMEHTAPHLVRPLPMLLPLVPSVSRGQGALATAGVHAGDLLRVAARTGRVSLPRPRRINSTEALLLAPVIRPDVRGAVLSWEGQLEDDARLVIALARTAAAHGAHVHTHTRVLSTDGSGAVLEDDLTGETREIRARVVINATGVWASTLVDDVRLRPSRGTHLVLRNESLPMRCALTTPVPGEANRYVFALPQPDGNWYVGLTDEPVDEVEDVPTPPEADIDFLLGVINRVLRQPLTRDDVVGTFAGLRPLLSGGGSTADLSRRHAVVVGPTGVVTVVGGKLTTYRRMAQDAVDVAVERAHLTAGPCRTTRLPLLGAASRERLLALDSDPRLVRRFGTEAPDVLSHAVEVTGLAPIELCSPASEQVPVTLAELVWGITHEGAVDDEDLLDRRVRVGLVAADRELVEPKATRAFQLVRQHRRLTRG